MIRECRGYFSVTSPISSLGQLSNVGTFLPRADVSIEGGGALLGISHACKATPANVAVMREEINQILGLCDLFQIRRSTDAGLECSGRGHYEAATQTKKERSSSTGTHESWGAPPLNAHMHEQFPALIICNHAHLSLLVMVTAY